MSKALVIVAILLALILVIPPLMTLSQTGDESGPTEEAASSPEFDIPSIEAAPPQWNAENLTGTAWEFDFMDHPDEAIREELAGRTVEYHFTGPNEIRVKSYADVGEDADTLEVFRSRLDNEGTYEIEDGQLELHAPSAVITIEETIEIRGEDLYRSGTPMARIDDGTGASARETSP